MATYFSGNPDIQADGLQTLVLMNPAGYGGFSDGQSPASVAGNLVFLNSTANFAHVPSLQSELHHSVAHDPNSEISGIHGFVQRLPYNLWTGIDQTRDVIHRPQQALSLSLSPQQQQQPAYVSYATAPESVGLSSPTMSAGVPNIQTVLLGSKYLKATQHLLDEVVTVIGGFTTGSSPRLLRSHSNRPFGPSPAAASEVLNDPRVIIKREISTTERQEIQLKKAKLGTMLAEVEHKYREYHRQMHVVISTFEQIAGIGSARSYTALALQTISKQFRSLKEAITGQIRAANRCLGEEEEQEDGKEGSRLKFMEHHIRQQRALQQLGMIQHNAWRPQRGLPERSVSVLRAWLFEHFLHPYPKDTDKHMLAKQTGLTRSQVSNWFINARVRLWKPMVEEMYLEEIKDHEQNQTKEKNRQARNSELLSVNPNEQHFNPTADDALNQTSTTAPATSSDGSNAGAGFVFDPHGSTVLDGYVHGSPPKKARNAETLRSMESELKPMHGSNGLVSMDLKGDRQNRDGYPALISNQTNFVAGLESYSIGEIGRFDAADHFAPRFAGNGVSLTLGLPHCENLATHQGFIPNQLGRRIDMAKPHDFVTINAAAAAAQQPTAYDNISIDSRKRFAAQLLPDFVA